MVGEGIAFLSYKSKNILYISSAIYNFIHHTWIFMSISHHSVSLALTSEMTLISPPLQVRHKDESHIRMHSRIFFLNGTQGSELAPDVLFYRETLYRLGGEFQRE